MTLSNFYLSLCKVYFTFVKSILNRTVMKTTYLLPHKYNTLGWIILGIGLTAGIFILLTDYESNFLTTKVLAVYNDEAIFTSSKGFFKIIENSIIDELTAIAIIIGGFLVVFSREKIEDEFISKLRSDSLIWAIVVNYGILVLAILFVFGLSFFDILVFNMFTPLLFFIFRFNFLKHKSRSHEE